MRLRRAAAVSVVFLATMGAAVAAIAVFSLDRDLSVGTVRLSADPGHSGALDIYVPLVDWGVRFDAVRLPARLSLDLRSVDRMAVAEVARGREPDVEALRHEAEDAIASYIRLLLAFVAATSLALGALTALALRGRAARLRLTLPVAGAGMLLACLAVLILLPPRGAIEDPGRSGVLRQRTGHPGRPPRDRPGHGHGGDDLAGAEHAARGPRPPHRPSRRARAGGRATPPDPRLGPP